MKYDAWGNCTVCNSDGTPNTSSTFIGNINPIRYRGYYWDKELGLYYLPTAVLIGAIIGTIGGGTIGYGVGYLAGGTYANGLVAKSVGRGVKTFLSQANKVHHVLGQAQSAYWAIAGLEVTFVVIDGVNKISEMWIR